MDQAAPQPPARRAWPAQPRASQLRRRWRHALHSGLLGFATCACGAVTGDALALQSLEPPSSSKPLRDTCEGACAPTRFRVDNHLPGTLHDFRLQVAEDRWLRIGDLGPGSSVFTAEVPRDLPFGVFEFHFANPPASGDASIDTSVDASIDASIGAYRIAADGEVRIDLEPAPGGLGAAGTGPGAATFGFDPAGPMPPGPLQAGPQSPEPPQRFPLVTVAAQRAEFTTGMFCGDWSIGGGVLLCWTPFMHYYAPMVGVGAGLSWGAFLSVLPASRLLQLFPVKATHVGLLLSVVDFSTVPAQPDTPSLHVGAFVGMGLDAAMGHAALGGFTRPGHDALPTGSYRASCGQPAYDPERATLRADCLDSRGRIQGSTLEVDACHGSGVMNDDGQLACEHPRGSYEQSCAPIRYQSGLLQAACTIADGQGTLAAELDYAGSCEPGSGVSNVDGALRCDALRLPPGPYRRACSNIHFDAGMLRADCGGGPDTRSTGLVLDYARSCRAGSGVGYAPRYAARGALFCEQAR